MDWDKEIVSIAKECLELNQALERITLEQADMEAQRIKKHDEWKDARDKLSKAFVRWNALTKYNRQWVDSEADRKKVSIHHINGIVTDNRPENIKVFSNG